jgi:poly(A) polymerase
MNTSQPQREIVTPRIYSRSEHPVSRRNIDPDALKIMYRLTRHGYKAFLVGGGVRDLLLNRKPKDFDIATDARPLRVKSLFRNCRIIGRRFKLAHIYFAGGKIIEVSTFRDSQPELDDGEERDGLLIKHDNVYGDERTDAVRRDLTMNALFYDSSSFSIIDYVGGMQDIKDRVTRVIGNPDIRFAEDPVRLMRIVRYAAKAGFGIEKECEKSILRNHELILKSSTMRVYEELKKDLCSGYSAKTLPLVCRYELLQHLLPELANKDILPPPDSPYTASLAFADELVAKHGLTTVTPMLCLLVLFMLRTDPATLDLNQHFSGADGIREFVAGAFSKLAVPKKEKEKIAGILSLWLKVLTTPPERLKPAQIARSEYCEDLMLLLEILNTHGQHQALLELLSGQESSRQPSSSRPPRSGDGRRRGRRRGGRSGRRGRHPMLRRM